MIYSIEDILNKTLRTEFTITQPGVIQYTIMIVKSCRYVCEIKIVTDDREVEIKTVLFSKLLQ